MHYRHALMGLRNGDMMMKRTMTTVTKAAMAGVTLAAFGSVSATALQVSQEAQAQTRVDGLAASLAAATTAEDAQSVITQAQADGATAEEVATALGIASIDSSNPGVVNQAYQTFLVANINNPNIVLAFSNGVTTAISRPSTPTPTIFGSNQTSTDTDTPTVETPVVTTPTVTTPTPAAGPQIPTINVAQNIANAVNVTVNQVNVGVPNNAASGATTADNAAVTNAQVTGQTTVTTGTVTQGPTASGASNPNG